MNGLALRDATPQDVPLVLGFVRALADYEKLLHDVQATEDDFRRLLFGEPRRAEALIAERGSAWPRPHRSGGCRARATMGCAS